MMQVIEMLKEDREKLRRESIIQGKIEYIKNMLKEKLPIDLICKITGISEKEINKIKLNKNKIEK